MRQFAQKMRNSQGRVMDVATLSRIVSGERELTLNETVQIANLFGLDVREVIKRAGFKVWI